MHDELNNLIQLFRKRTGLQVKSRDQFQFAELVKLRMKALRLADYADYRARLLAEDLNNSSEWDHLISQFTVGESYFFRDIGQIHLLEQIILPELIRKNQHNRQLKIWSAGCSSGEEPYSIAMLLDAVLPDKSDWKIEIIGTDIDREAIKACEKGIYSNWSFRQAEHQRFLQHFEDVEGGRRISDEIRQFVSFYPLNLAEADYSRIVPVLINLDLIVCRNVFIYFDRNTCSEILERFTDSLVMDGYLMTGHSELFELELHGLKPRLYPESMIYLKQKAVAWRDIPSTSFSPVARQFESRSKPAVVGKKEKHSMPSMRVASPEPTTACEVDCMQVAQAAFARGEYAIAIHSVETVASSDEDYCPARLLVARALANLGLHEQAMQALDEALEKNEFAAEIYYFRSHILELAGDSPKAIEMMEKALYLDENYVPAYVELAAMLERNDRGTRAARLRKTAISLLEKLPENQSIEPYEQMTAGELLKYLRT